MGDKLLRERLGQRACREVLEKHTWDKNADAVLKHIAL